MCYGEMDIDGCVCVCYGEMDIDGCVCGCVMERWTLMGVCVGVLWRDGH